jgi:G:T/U-mismatch repair DNA glycosylase
MLIEQHPFRQEISNNTRAIITGTFPGRHFAQQSKSQIEADSLAFSYAGRNQLWKIMESIYGISLVTRADKENFLLAHDFALLDLYQSVMRKKASNLDSDLIVVSDNKLIFEQIFQNEKIQRVLCTGKGVANILISWFPNEVEKIVALPSPSPAYASMTLAQKTIIYKQILSV